MRRITCGICICLFFTTAMAAAEHRNPFDIPDIEDPTGEDVRAHAARITLPGDDKDFNAPAWPPAISKDEPMKIDGVWWGRYDSGLRGAYSDPEVARIAKRGDRLFILQGIWYVEAIKQKDGSYAGRWVSKDSTTGGGTWVGRLVNDQRIDGDWDSGRWDFRRKFK